MTLPSGSAECVLEGCASFERGERCTAKTHLEVDAWKTERVHHSCSVRYSETLRHHVDVRAWQILLKTSAMPARSFMWHNCLPRANALLLLNRSQAVTVIGVAQEFSSQLFFTRRALAVLQNSQSIWRPFAYQPPLCIMAFRQGARMCEWIVSKQVC